MGADLGILSNFQKFSTFFCQTMDKIASLKHDEKIPVFIFDIRELIATKIPE